MPKSRKQVAADHYAKKKETHFMFMKWIRKDNIKPISKAEIEAFADSKSDRRALIDSVADDLPSVKGK